MKKRIVSIVTIACFLFYLFSNCNSGDDTRLLPTDSITISKGQNSFANKCNSCHNFNYDGIGPQLAGVTSEKSVGWLKNFIRDPKKVIESGDTTGKKLFEKYKTLMPSFAYLPDEEINAILAFIDSKKKLERPVIQEDTNDIKNPIPDTIKSSDLVVDLNLVTQIPRSSDEPPLTRITKLDYQPNTGDLFILDLRGKLYRLQNGEQKVYMDMVSLKPKFINQPGLATGFGSFAFHPEFSKNGLLYTTHTEPPASAKADFSYPDSIPVLLQWVLTEWKTDPLAFPFSGTGREILRIDMPTAIHGMQEITFNRLAKPGDKDYGLLYIGIGDGGSAEIGHALVSPIPDKIWGSIIRIDPSGNNSKNGKYGIPGSNPFYKTENEKSVPEIYAWGFRNPHRISWSKSGQLLAVNIGEHNIEALNIIEAGHFYGWPIREGTFLERFFYNTGKIYPLPGNDSVYHVTYPVAQFDHDEGVAISGGFEYRGTAIPQLAGKYLFGDIAAGKLFYVNMKDLRLGTQATIKKWKISFKGVPTTLAQLCGKDRVEMRFGMDSKGELYLLTKADGKVYKLASATLKR
ncbi:MAG TPA: PQQ-dependent sugar dehydrogenase [Chitinophagaceae bacterium]|nr:PQQ-dependent sugar dehydrogenase [Chitinophagaceae bacterium]